jgi:hypothetical protein
MLRWSVLAARLALNEPDGVRIPAPLRAIGEMVSRHFYTVNSAVRFRHRLLCRVGVLAMHTRLSSGKYRIVTDTRR